MVNKRTYKPRKRRTTKKTFRKSRGLLAPKFLQKHKYVENALNLASSTTQDAVSVYRFSANGLYDPNITGTGHQPMLFDQCSALYDHYVVIGAKITVRANNVGSEDACLLLRCNDSTTAPSLTRSAWLEQGNCTAIYLPGRTSGGSNSTRVFTYKVNPNKFLGRASPMSDPELKGSAVGNPTEQCYFDIGYCTTASGAIAANLDVMVDIDYTAVWIEHKPIGQS